MGRKIRRIIILFIIVLCFSGCLGKSDEKKIAITESRVQIEVGETYTLAYQLTGIGKDEIEHAFSDESIARAEGFTILGLAPGTTVLTVSYVENETIFDKVTIEVIGRPRVKFTRESIVLTVGERAPLPLEYENIAGFEELAFLLSAEGIVFFDDEEIIAQKTGEVIITAYYVFDNSVFSEIAVFVEEEKSLSFFKSKLEIEAGESAFLPLITEGIPDLTEIIFSFSVAGIAEVDELTVTGLKAGETALTAALASDETVTASILIVVKPRNYTVEDPEYWIERLSPEYDPDEVIFTPSEISQYNQNIYNNNHLTKVVNLLASPETAPGAEVKQKINAYNEIIDSRSVYRPDGKALSELEKDEIKEYRNMDAIPATVLARYGIITEFAAVRSFPTNYYAYSRTQDYFQETGLNVGEGVVIYHETNDGKWFFVQATNYYGWVEAAKIGVCNREEMRAFLDAERFIVVVANVLTIGSQRVRMGQALPYLSENEDEYVVLMPRRDDEGGLVLRQVAVAKNEEEVHDGYLPYTLRNVLYQAFKMLNSPYSWGDAYITGRDCSSTQNAIYSCFGFKMPRNTTQQRSIPQYSQSGNINENFIKNNLRPGALIFAKGHVMMYIGDDDSGNAYIFHNTTSGHNKCVVQQFRTFSGNIIAYLKLY
ncbi:MAG: SH3 domain-containing protein [Bacilli bacterium]